MGKNRFRQRTRQGPRKGALEEWQVQAAYAMQRNLALYPRQETARGVTQRLFDMRSCERSKGGSFAAKSSALSGNSTDQGKATSSKEYVVAGNRDSNGQDRRKLQHSGVISLVSLCARSILLHLDLYKQFPDLFELLPWYVKNVLLEEAALLSCNQAKRNRIIRDDVLPLLLHEDIRHLNLSCSLISDDCVDVLRPKLDKSSESRMPNETELWEDLDDGDVDVTISLQGLVQLTSLDVSFCFNLTEDFVHRIGRDIPRLRNLRLAGVFDDEAGLHAIVELVKPSQFDALVELDLSDSPWLSLSMLLNYGVICTKVTTVLTSLERLVVENCDQVQCQTKTLLLENPLLQCEQLSKWNKSTKEMLVFYNIRALKSPTNTSLYIFL